LQLNGKLVYFLLALLIGLITWQGRDIIYNQKETKRAVDELTIEMKCLQTDFQNHIRYLHKDDVKDGKMDY